MKGTAREHAGWISLLIILLIFIVMVFVFVLGLDKKIIDSIKVVIRIIEVGP